MKLYAQNSAHVYEECATELNLQNKESDLLSMLLWTTVWKEIWNLVAPLSIYLLLSRHA